MEQVNKKKNVLEIIVCFSLILLLTSLVDIFANDCGRWLGVAIYWSLALSVFFYVLKVERKPLTSIGAKRITFNNIFAGLVLGCVMFIVQQIPLMLMGMDYSILAMAPDVFYMLSTTIYCFLCVGLTEELIFRGFILQKTLEVCPIKWIAIVINIGLFYVVHWSTLPPGLGGIYNITMNVSILCIYYLSRKERDLISLIIGHGLYDTLTSVVLPVFVYLYH